MTTRELLLTILERLVRLETKVAKLMEHVGLSADGRTVITKEIANEH